MTHFRMTNKRAAALDVARQINTLSRPAEKIDTVRLSDDLTWIRDALDNYWAEHPLPNRLEHLGRLHETLTYCAQAGYLREYQERK